MPPLICGVRGRNLLGHVVDAAADQVLHRGTGAAIGHMGDLGAHRAVEQDGADVAAGAHAGRAVLQRVLVRLHVGDELLEVLAGKFLRAISTRAESENSATCSKSAIGL